MGKAFYTEACLGLINQWFSDYDQAIAALAREASTSWLIPYQKQFIVVKKEYLGLLNAVEGCDRWWQDINHDLYGGYNTPAWDQLAAVMIRSRSYTG